MLEVISVNHNIFDWLIFKNIYIYINKRFIPVPNQYDLCLLKITWTEFATFSIQLGEHMTHLFMFGFNKVLITAYTNNFKNTTSSPFSLVRTTL